MFVNLFVPVKSLISPIRQGTQTEFKTRSGEISYDYTHDMFYFENASFSDDSFGDIVSTVFTVDGSNVQFNYTFRDGLEEFFSGNSDYDVLIGFVAYYPYGYKESINNITEIIIFNSLNEMENVSLYIIMSMNYTDYIADNVFDDQISRCSVEIGLCDVDYDTNTISINSVSSGLVYDSISPIAGDMFFRNLHNSTVGDSPGDSIDMFSEFDESDKEADIFTTTGIVGNPVGYNMFLEASRLQKITNNSYSGGDLDFSGWDGVDSEDIINPFSIQSKGIIPIIIISLSIIIFIIIVYTDRKNLIKQKNYRGKLKKKNRYLY